VVSKRDAGVPHCQLVGREAVPGHGEGGGAGGPAMAIDEEWVVWAGGDSGSSSSLTNCEAEQE